MHCFSISRVFWGKLCSVVVFIDWLTPDCDGTTEGQCQWWQSVMQNLKIQSCMVEPSPATLTWLSQHTVQSVRPNSSASQTRCFLHFTLNRTVTSPEHTLDCSHDSLSQYFSQLNTVTTVLVVFFVLTVTTPPSTLTFLFTLVGWTALLSV